jgi:hypothetical protein
MDGLSQPWQFDFAILGQSLVALALGGVIGWERERAGKWAGLRTHMLVCLAAMLFARLGTLLVLDFHRAVGAETLARTHPSDGGNCHWNCLHRRGHGVPRPIGA